MKNSSENRRDPRRMAMLAAFLGSLLLSGYAVAASGVCTTAEVAEPFRVPGGPVQSPARLTLCERGEFSPVASFHEVRIDGMPVGLLTSRNEPSEGGRELPFLMFSRDADGRLTLLGYAYPTREGMRTYAFGPAPATNVAQAKRDAAAAPQVLVAARLD